MPQKFTVTIPVKPYVKRYLELNYGLPCDFANDKDSYKFFREKLRKPNSRYDNKYADQLCTYNDEIEVLISKEDFYRYGWELSKTDIVAFGKRFEDRAKLISRTYIEIKKGLGKQLKDSIADFQVLFDEDVWPADSIKKDISRNGSKIKMEFTEDLHLTLNRIFITNLLQSEIITKKGQKYYLERI